LSTDVVSRSLVFILVLTMLIAIIKGLFSALDATVVLVGSLLLTASVTGIGMLMAGLPSLTKTPKSVEEHLHSLEERVLLLTMVALCGSVLSGGLLALVVLRPQVLVKSLVVQDDQGGGSIGLSVVDGSARLELRDNKGNLVVLTPRDVSFSGEKLGKAAALGLSAGMGQLNLLGSIGKSVTAYDGKVSTNQMEARAGDRATSLEGGRVTVTGSGGAGQMSANSGGTAVTLSSVGGRTVLKQDELGARLEMSENGRRLPLLVLEATDSESPAGIRFDTAFGRAELDTQKLSIRSETEAGPFIVLTGDGARVEIAPPFIRLNDQTKGVYWCARNWLPLPPLPLVPPAAELEPLYPSSSGITFEFPDRLPLPPREDRQDWAAHCNGGR